MEFDVTRAVIKEAAGDRVLSLRLVPDGTYQHYAHFRDKEYKIESRRPHIVVQTHFEKRPVR